MGKPHRESETQTHGKQESKCYSLSTASQPQLRTKRKKNMRKVKWKDGYRVFDLCFRFVAIWHYSLSTIHYYYHSLFFPPPHLCSIIYFSSFPYSQTRYRVLFWCILVCLSSLLVFMRLCCVVFICMLHAGSLCSWEQGYIRITQRKAFYFCLFSILRHFLTVPSPPPRLRPAYSPGGMGMGWAPNGGLCDEETVPGMAWHGMVCIFIENDFFSSLFPCKPSKPNQMHVLFYKKCAMHWAISVLCCLSNGVCSPFNFTPNPSQLNSTRRNSQWSTLDLLLSTDNPHARTHSYKHHIHAHTSATLRWEQGEQKAEEQWRKSLLGVNAKEKRKTTAARPSLPPSTLTRGGGEEKKSNTAVHCIAQCRTHLNEHFALPLNFFFFFCTIIFIGHWSKGGVEATIGQKRAKAPPQFTNEAKVHPIGQHHTHATLTKTCFYFHHVLLFSFLVRPYSFLFLWCTSRIM